MATNRSPDDGSETVPALWFACVAARLPAAVERGKPPHCVCITRSCRADGQRRVKHSEDSDVSGWMDEDVDVPARERVAQIVESTLGFRRSSSSGR